MQERASSDSPPLPVEAKGPAHDHLRTLKRMALIILVVLFFAVCYFAQEILIPLTLSLLLSLLLSPLVGLLQRAHLPRALASLVMLAFVIAAIGGTFVYFAGPAQEGFAAMPKAMQGIEQRLRSWRAPIRQAQDVSKRIENLTKTGDAATVVVAQPDLLTTLAINTPRALASIAVVLLLTYFFLSSGDGFLRRMVEITPRLHDKKVVVAIARDIQAQMSSYLLTISLINLALGVVVALAMWLLGLPNAFLWGAVAAVMNYAPYAGPALTALALALAGFSAFDSFAQAITAPAVFFAIVTIEGQLITPTIIGRRLALDPTVVFVWLLLWGWLWGVVGILLAGPLLACFRIVCQHTEALKPVSVLIGASGAE